MSFKDYSRTPNGNTLLGDGTYIGPNMLRNKVRPALQQIAADGKELSDAILPAGDRAGKFLAWDAIGNPYGTSGTGSDASLRSDLANSGASLVGYGGSSVANVLSAVQDAPPTTWGPAKTIRWDGYIGGQIPSEVSFLGAATATINSDKMLEVTAPYAGATTVILNARFAEGVLAFQIKKGKFMLRIMDPLGDTSGRAIYSADGAALTYQFLKADGTLQTAYGTNASGLAGSTGDLIWIELASSSNNTGSIWYLRSWKDGDPRPSSPVLSDFYPDTTGYVVNDGVIRLSSFDVPAKFGTFIIRDGRQGTSASNVELVGRWFPAFNNGALCMKTICTGAQMRFVVKGASKVTARYAGTFGNLTGDAPVVDAYILNADGSYAHSGPVTFSGANNLASLSAIDLVTGLDPTLSYNVEVRVRSVSDAQDKWNAGYGLAIQSLVPADGSGNAAGTIAPWKDDRPAMIFFGDSTSIGVRARYNAGTPGVDGAIVGGGDIAWPVLLCQSRNLKPIMVGLGGTGIAKAFGTQPATPANAFNYMLSRPVDTEAENVKYGSIMVGINDAAGTPTSTSAFQAAMTAFLRQVLIRYPGLVKFWVIRDLAGDYQAQLIAAVAAVGDPRIVYLTTNGFTVATTDGTHFSVTGNQQFATQISPLMDFNGGVIV